jgi:hypothetical protein
MDFRWQGEFGIHDSTINQYSNALNWTATYWRMHTQSIATQTKLHAGFTFWGVSKFHSPAPVEFRGTEKHELNNFGFGLNAKRIYGLDLGKRNRIELNRFNYILWPYPGTSDVTQGTVKWRFTDLTYSILITEHISLGFAASLAREQGRFHDFPDTDKSNNAMKMFVAWHM